MKIWQNAGIGKLYTRKNTNRVKRKNQSTKNVQDTKPSLNHERIPPLLPIHKILSDIKSVSSTYLSLVWTNLQIVFSQARPLLFRSFLLRSCCCSLFLTHYISISGKISEGIILKQTRTYPPFKSKKASYLCFRSSRDFPLLAECVAASLAFPFSAFWRFARAKSRWFPPVILYYSFLYKDLIE